MSGMLFSVYTWDSVRSQVRILCVDVSLLLTAFMSCPVSLLGVIAMLHIPRETIGSCS